MSIDREKLLKNSKFSDILNHPVTANSFCKRSRDVAMATNFRAKCARFADPTDSCRFGVPNVLPDRNSNFRRLTGNNFSINYVKFGEIPSNNPDFTTLECIKQASIITGVSLTTFVKGRGIARYCSYQQTNLFHHC